MQSHVQKPLSYEIPPPPGGPAQIDRFPDGGVTIVIPSPKPAPTRDLVIAVIVTAGALAIFVFLFARMPQIWLCVCSVVACLGVIGNVLMFTMKPRPEVVGLSPKTIYIRAKFGRAYEAPLATLKSIKIDLPEDKPNTTPSVRLEVKTRAGNRLFQVGEGRSDNEIARAVQTLSEHWEALLKRERAVVSNAILTFIHLYQKNPAANDRTLFGQLTAEGIDPSLAVRLLLMVPTACIRHLHKNTTTFHGYCLIVDPVGKPLRRLYVNDNEVFEQTTEMFDPLRHDVSLAGVLKDLARRAPEAASIQQRGGSPGE